MVLTVTAGTVGVLLITVCFSRRLHCSCHLTHAVHRISFTEHAQSITTYAACCERYQSNTHPNDSAAIPHDATYGMVQYTLQSMPSIAKATMIVPNYGATLCGISEVLTDIQVVS